MHFDMSKQHDVDAQLPRDRATQRLLTELRCGKMDAYEDLFDLHSDQILTIIRFRMDRRLAARVDAEDILQDVFLAGKKRVDNLARSATESFLVWIRLIVRQTIIDLARYHLTAERRSVLRESRPVRDAFHSDESFSMANLLVSGMATPSKIFSQREMVARVEQCLETLRPEDREIIALRHYEELSNQEVAEILDVSSKAASIRYVRALSRLKSALGAIESLPDSNDQLPGDMSP